MIGFCYTIIWGTARTLEYCEYVLGLKYDYRNYIETLKVTSYYKPMILLL
ncbi:MAG: hypothetical protein ACI9Y7_001535, partial [Dokdonia sp.]